MVSVEVSFCTALDDEVFCNLVRIAGLWAVIFTGIESIWQTRVMESAVRIEVVMMLSRT